MLECYFTQPFTSASQVFQIDTFVTNGGATYPVNNKLITQVNGNLQYSSIIKNLYGGGFTLGSNSITLNTTPVPGLQGVIPSINGVVCNTYDNTNVKPNGNIDVEPFYIGNISTIFTNMYTAIAGSAGIAISLVNNITSVGPDLTWVQLACSDANGNALTFQATGTTLYTADIKGFSTLAASAAQGSNMLVIAATANPSQFWAGDFIIINDGQNSQEIQRTNAVTVGATSTILGLAGSTNFSHFVGETVIDCIRQFYIKQTTPIGFTNNKASNYYNISTLVQCDERVRP